MIDSSKRSSSILPSGMGLCGSGKLLALPLGTMLEHPVGQREFETNVIPGLLRFEPFVPQDFLPFRLEELVEGEFR